MSDPGTSIASFETQTSGPAVHKGRSRTTLLENRSNAIWLGAILLLALALRLYNLERLDIWVDEANGILTAKQSFGAILELLARDSSPPLYYFLLHGWMGIFGDSPVAVRSLSISASLLLIALVYTIGRREISHRAGCWAAFIVAISPSQVAFSQQARMYTLLPLFALLSWWFLVRTLRSGSRRDFALCMVATSLALYTHNFAIYVLVVLAALVLISGQLFSRFRLWLLAVAIQVLLYAAWIPTFLKQVDNQDHYSWFLWLWQQFGLFGVLERSFRSFAPTGVFVMSAGGEDVALHGIPAAVAVAAAASGVFLMLRRWRDKTALDVLWIPIALVIPIAISLAVSQMITPHFVPGRVDQMLLPAFALLAGTGIASLEPTWLRRTIAPLLVGVSLIPITYFMEPEPRLYITKGSDAEMAEAVIALWRPIDVILCTSLTRAPLEYYLGRAGIEARILSFPRHTARNLGAQNDARLVRDSKALEREAKTVLDEARRLTEPDGHLFLLRSDTQVNTALLPKFLRSRFYIRPEVILGNFDQTGTGEVIAASLNRIHAPTARTLDDGSGPAGPKVVAEPGSASR